MTLPVGGRGPDPIQQAESVRLRDYLPKDLEGTAGKKLNIDNWLVKDRTIKSISYQKAGALESCTIVTDEETISLAETVDKGQYGIMMTRNGTQYSMAVSGGIGEADLVLSNDGTADGGLKGARIAPGFAKAKFEAAIASVTATIK
jgi:hypothetical protein